MEVAVYLREELQNFLRRVLGGDKGTRYTPTLVGTNGRWTFDSKL